jgi:hypothetical protein
LDTFYSKLNQPSVNTDWKEGTFNTWADQPHSRAQSQMLPLYGQPCKPSQKDNLEGLFSFRTGGIYMKISARTVFWRKL